MKVRVWVTCSICDCAAPSEPMDPPGTLTASEVADLSEAIAHLGTCPKFTPPKTGRWRFCGPGGRPGAKREVRT